MVDLKAQYENLQSEIDESVISTIRSTAFINGPQVKSFSENLARYLGAKKVIPCANGTDALQIALMSLGLKPGDEVIVPSFTYVATAEVIGLLGLTPIMVDVDENSFNVTADLIEPYITEKTKAIVPVHLFGQSADMDPIMDLAEANGLFVIEDNAQAIGSVYTSKTGDKKRTGTIGHIGCTSFYPSKNLGAYGDGGAIFTNDETLGKHISQIANHGQGERYYHDYLGVNSRLDSVQAAILNVKLKHLDTFGEKRDKNAAAYDELLKSIPGLETPHRSSFSTHVFHQYTLKIKNGKRDALAEYLKNKSIPNMIYYPVPLYKQRAYSCYFNARENLATTEMLCKEVLSLPMHPDLESDQIAFISDSIHEFFK